MPSVHVPIRISNLRVHTTNQPTWVESQGTNIASWALSFPDAVESRAHFVMPVLPNYNGSATGLTMRLRWRGTTAGTNSVVWRVYGVAGASFSAGNTATTTNVTTPAPASAGNIVETVVPLASGTAFNPSASNNAMAFTVARMGADGSDTYTGNAELLDIILEYDSVDVNFLEKYFWVPAGAMVIPAGSTVTVDGTSGVDTGIIRPKSAIFTDSSSSVVDFNITMPDDFAGGLSYKGYFIGTGSSNSFFLDVGAASIGTSSDPVLVTGSTQNWGLSSVTSNISVSQSISANQEVNFRLKRDPADANTGTTTVLGLLFKYNTLSKNPNRLLLDPGSCTLPTSNPATLTLASDTNSTKQSLRFATGSTNSADFVGWISSLFQSVSAVKVTWRSSGTGDAYLRCDYAYVNTGSTADPTLTTGTPIAATNSGAGQINVTTFTVPTGAAASRQFYLRLNRLGSSGSDTISANVEVLEVALEFNT